MDAEDGVYYFSPSISWSDQDWKIVETNYANIWTMTPYKGLKFIRIEGGVPIPWPKEGIRIKFEERMAVEFEPIAPEDS